jgi:hypothetical protein
MRSSSQINHVDLVRLVASISRRNDLWKVTHPAQLMAVHHLLRVAGLKPAYIRISPPFTATYKNAKSGECLTIEYLAVRPGPEVCAAADLFVRRFLKAEPNVIDMKKPNQRVEW